MNTNERPPIGTVEFPHYHPTTSDYIERREIVAIGSMAGAHGHPNALHWAVTTTGETYFHDTARSIYGVITLASYVSGAEAVRRGYLRGYDYASDSGAAYLDGTYEATPEADAACAAHYDASPKTLAKKEEAPADTLDPTPDAAAPVAPMRGHRAGGLVPYDYGMSTRGDITAAREAISHCHDGPVTDFVLICRAVEGAVGQEDGVTNLEAWSNALAEELEARGFLRLGGA